MNQDQNDLKNKLLDDFHGFELQINESLKNKPITVSLKAKKYIETMMALDDSAELIRVSVIGGGCSGLTYGFAMEAKASFDKNQDSIIIDSPLIIIDKESKEYLPGAKINLQENALGKRIFIDNPAAIQTCGCGESFRVEYGN
jgi:iron-sulfur cluster insertion protein